jgi:hypothetical protein
MTRLTGAALNSHARRVLIDRARSLIRYRDPNAIADVVALLEQADALTRKGGAS